MSSGDVAAALARLGSATIGESGGLAAHRRIRPAWSGAAVAAPVYTVGCTPGDNLAVHVAVTKAPKGSVLVVDVGQVADRGYLGRSADHGRRSRRLGGLDPRRRRARCGCPRGASLPGVLGNHRPHRGLQGQAGDAGFPVRVGGVEVSTGDWAVADVDGVAFVPGGRLDDVLAAGNDRETRQAGFSDALKAGSTTVGLLGLDASLIREA